MENNPAVDFSIDREFYTITVKKTFLASVERVWDAWTLAEELDQWWAPKPWKAVTKTMDFKEGGFWLYSMEGPKGEQSWGKARYQHIDKLRKFEVIDTFCDENGVDDPALPTLHWTTNFDAVDNKTLVTAEVAFDTLVDLEKILEMGFKEGFIAALGNLDEYFKR